MVTGMHLIVEKLIFDYVSLFYSIILLIVI